MSLAKALDHREVALRDVEAPQTRPVAVRCALRLAQALRLAPALLSIHAVAIAGCASTSHVQLAAADSMQSLVEQLSLSLDEYHADLAAFDQERQRGALEAFIERTQQAAKDVDTGTGAARANAEALLAAMEKLRLDREAAMSRYINARENLGAMVEVAAGLRRSAVEAMSADDELKRYLGVWLEKPLSSQKASPPSFPRGAVPAPSNSARDHAAGP